MRIIAGTKRGMRLLSPKGYETTRPITDRVKESVFDVLYKYDIVEGGVVADLFCGTGSLGLEALSRGAGWVTFVDKDRKVVEILKKNIERAGFVSESKVISANAFKIGAAAAPDGQKCGLVFVDPPYAASCDTDADSQIGKLLYFLCEQAAEGAIVVVRTHEKTELLEGYGQLKVIDRRRWGSMNVALLQLGG